MLKSGYSDFKKHLSSRIKDYYDVDNGRDYFTLQEIPQSLELKIWTRKGVLADYYLEEQSLYWFITQLYIETDRKRS